MLRACKFCVDSLPGGRWLSCGGNGQHKQHLQKIARSPRANSSFREIECKAHSRALEKPQSPAPACGPVSTADLEKLITFVHDHNNVLVITGAGCSTESNIPDYRGPRGAYTSGFKPMTHQQFMANDANRRRYWARSFVGWREFADVQPNGAHEGLARLQANGWVSSILTQNVDRLHQKAGARHVLEIHGTTHEVECVSCSWRGCRYDFQQRLEQMNPVAAEFAEELYRRKIAIEARKRSLAVGARLDADKVSMAEHDQVPVRRPDGDVELVDAGEKFSVPACPVCRGVLKPAVVFFGGSVVPSIAARAAMLAENCHSALIVGTSLSTLSVYKHVLNMAEQGKPLAAINVGDTRADGLLDFKVAARAGETLMRLASHPKMLLPRPVS